MQGWQELENALHEYAADLPKVPRAVLQADFVAKLIRVSLQCESKSRDHSEEALENKSVRRSGGGEDGKKSC